jgi:hypothetical protein
MLTNGVISGNDVSEGVNTTDILDVDRCDTTEILDVDNTAG